MKPHTRRAHTRRLTSGRVVYVRNSWVDGSGTLSSGGFEWPEWLTPTSTRSTFSGFALLAVTLAATLMLANLGS